MATIEPKRIFSYGGGVQSFTALLMQVNGDLPKPFDLFIFAEVGSDSERPQTLTHVQDIAIPLAEKHGIKFMTVHRLKYGQRHTLLQNLVTENAVINFPVYLASGAPISRNCTVDYKINPVQRGLKAMYQGCFIELGLGFSSDEAYRVTKKHPDWHDNFNGRRFGFIQHFTYPLIEAGMSRTDCHAYIARHGFTSPPKSSCWFCPYTSRTEWTELRRNEPELFQKAVDLEHRINEQRAALGKDRIFIHRSLKPLEDAVGLQATLFDLFTDTDEECQTGYCGL